MKKKTTFPCYLSDIADPAAGPLWHVTAEGKGMRFYLGSAATAGEAEKLVGDYAKAYAGNGISFYLVDRSGSHFISGGHAEFVATFQRSEART